MARVAHERNPGGLVVEDKVFTSSSGVRLKPDIVLEVDEKIVVVNLAITWDKKRRDPQTEVPQDSSEVLCFEGSVSWASCVIPWYGLWHAICVLQGGRTG